MKDVANLLVDLIRIDSSPEADKEAIIAYCEDVLRGSGMDVEVVDGAIVASSGKGGGILSGHLDTVPMGDGWTHGQGEIVDGNIYGRGATDMKGGVAAILVACRELVERDMTFTVYLTTDEEVKMDQAKLLAKRDSTKDAKAILVCEPTNMNVAYAEKGVFRFRLIARGKAGHSSSPWLGDNAIHKMVEIVSMLTEFHSNKPTGGLTISVNIIQGGIKDNVIPDLCYVDVDARYPPSMGRNEVTRIVAERLSCCDYEMEVRKDISPFTADVFDTFNERLIGFLGTDAVILPYATEASVFGKVNGSVYVCGPGMMDALHTIDEFIELSQLDQMIDLVRFFVEQTQG